MPEPHENPFDLLAWAKTIAPFLPEGPDGETWTVAIEPMDSWPIPSLDDVMTGSVAMADPDPRRRRPKGPSPATQDWVRHWAGRFGQCN